jgi:Tol biopolymer transport system component
MLGPMITGETISHYRVLGLLGAGGMGEVYKAEDTRLRRPVALKLLRLGLVQDPDAKARLVHEAQAASALDHPNICTIHEIDETPDGRMFVAMAFYEGETLKQRISAGPLPIDDATDIVVQVARAVAAAHDAGVIHRDIKPANIMLTRRGGVKLLDFGVAKLAGQTALTQTGTTLGTVAYMAPEQFTGLVDRQSDVWALGVILYECLAGRLPFAGQHELAIMRAIADDAPRPLREARPDVRPELESVITRALQKDRPARYASADDFIRDLQTLRAGPATATVASARAGASTAAPAASLQDRRRRVRRTVLTVCAVALLGTALWVVLGPNERTPAESAARPVSITRFPGLEVEPAMSPTGNLVAFAWNGTNEDNFDIYVRSIDGSSDEKRLTTDASPDHAPAWSPDGLRLAFVRVVAGRRIVMAMPALGGAEEQLFDAWGSERSGWSSGGWVYGLSWTPDGKHLVFGDQNASDLGSAIYLYSLQDGQRRQLTKPPSTLNDIHPVVSPNGRYLAFVRLTEQSRGGDVFLQKLDDLQPSGEPTQLTFGHTVQAFDWAQDSRSVVHDGGRGEPGLWRVGVGGGASEVVWANVRAAMPSLARSGAGVVYEANAFDTNIYELRLPSSPNSQAPTDETRAIASTSPDSDMRLSPDGTRIAFVSGMSGDSDLWVSNRDGSQARKLTNFRGGRAGSPCWSADGKSIAFDAVRPGGSWSLYVVDADSNPIVRPVISDRYNNVRPAWSLDGKWIYFQSDRTGDLQIWKVPSAGGIPEQITRNGGVDPIVSPDGRDLYYAKPPAQGIWKVPFDGGPEVKVVERGRPLAFDVADTGIFIMDASAKPQATVEMFSFAMQKLVSVARLPAGLRMPESTYLNVTRDGRSMLYVRFDQRVSDIDMLPGVR